MIIQGGAPTKTIPTFYEYKLNDNTMIVDGRVLYYYAVLVYSGELTTKHRITNPGSHVG